MAAANIVNFSFDSEQDPLALLPQTQVREYKKGQVIYGPHDHNRNLYRIIMGRVKLSRVSEDGTEVILDFYDRDDFLGETGCLGSNPPMEQATALANASLMSWTSVELKQGVARAPGLGAALLRVLAQKLANANERIESFSRDLLNRRLVKALMDLGVRLGQPSDGQMLHLARITHAQIARYVGTSRELVTQSMNQLRRDQVLQYSRRGIDLDVAALKGYLANSTRAASGRRKGSRDLRPTSEP